MKKMMLALAMFALLFTGCTAVQHTIVVSNDGEINPEFYSEITPISETEDGVCAVTEFIDNQSEGFDNVVDIRAEQIRKTMGISVLVIKDETSCEYRAFGVKYKDASKIKKAEPKKAAKSSKKKGKKKAKVEEEEEEEEEEEDDEEE